MNRPTAKTVTFGEGKTFSLDQHGFLDPPQQWDEVYANGMARLQGIYDGLTKDHWEFISYIRKKVLTERTLPFLVVACADNNLRLDKLKSLFPTGYFRGACRIAGVSYQFLSDVNIWHTYETAPRLKAEYQLTPQGFLVDFHQWNERFADLVCAELNLPNGLTSKHGEVIRFLRNYYQATSNIPTVYEAARLTAWVLVISKSCSQSGIDVVRAEPRVCRSSPDRVGLRPPTNSNG